MKRRERTRHLIELGGLVAKAGLVELAEDDRAVILGILVEAAAQLQGENRKTALTLWQRRGRRAFADDAEARTESVGAGCGRVDAAVLAMQADSLPID